MKGFNDFNDGGEGGGRGGRKQGFFNDDEGGVG